MERELNVTDEIGLSPCCNAMTRTQPPSLGEPAFTYCDNCYKQCEIIWNPAFEKIGNGHYRKIIYPLTANKIKESFKP